MTENKIKIYLAGPVDNCTEKEQTIWRHVTKQAKPEYEYLDLMHYEVDVVRGKKTFAELIELEKNDIYNCDVLLAWKPGSGTAMEIMYAYMLNMDQRRNNKINIVVVGEKNKYLSPWINHHATVVVSDFHEAFQWIDKNTNIT